MHWPCLVRSLWGDFNISNGNNEYAIYKTSKNTAIMHNFSYRGLASMPYTAKAESLT